MRALSLPQKVALGAYLFVVGILAVNIHIRMLEAGIPHPRGLWNEPSWYPFLKHLVQLMAMAWLHRMLKERFPTFGYWRNTLVLFAIMVTLMELTLRLPVTAGYVNGRAFLFTWTAAYLPETITLFFSTAAVVLLASVRLKGSIRRVVVGVGLSVTAVLVWKASEPLAGRLAEVGARLFGPPNPQDVLAFPYGPTVTLIASVSFIEPTVSCFAVGWLIWDRLSSNNGIRILQFTLLILMLVYRLVDQTIFMIYSTLPPMRAFLSMGQFTLEWVFMGSMIPVAIIFLHRAEGTSKLNPD